ncbi:hypothetical protein DL546_006011 [Coniochaeta pulveracea]|uniref:Uncharacterized protein n=1 Tax=Coniochaeta pulveracea TaxID=177199 RepID=A0A420YCF3_9PEZI|nr:hypothetical protein DL546_006011 [Coniochaeta pulveracea]
MTSGGGSSHECYPPSPESYACDDPAPASTTTQPGECDTDRTGDFVADRQLSFERHEQYGYAPVRASIRRVADRRRDIRQIELAQARAVRDAKRDRGQRSGGSGKGTGNK